MVINETQKIKMFNKLKIEFKSLKDTNISVLGLTYKIETDGMRAALSIDNIELLLLDGASIHVYNLMVFKVIKDIIN